MSKSPKGLIRVAAMRRWFVVKQRSGVISNIDLKPELIDANIGLDLNVGAFQTCIQRVVSYKPGRGGIA